MRLHHKAAIGVAVIAALVFLPSLGGAFVYDDIPLISTNEYIHSWEWLPRAFKTHFWDVALYEDALEMRADARQYIYYRPLVTLSYLFNWMLGGGKAWTFHLVNVLLHSATAALAVRAATRWTKSIRLGALCGLVFAIHPSRTEAVTWISGRTDIMMMLFLLLALEAFHARRRRWSFVLAILAQVAAILSKEPGAMLALLVLADRESVAPSRRSWKAVIVSGALGLAYVGARAIFWAPEGKGGRVLTPEHFVMTVGAYVQRAIVPWPATMNALEVDASGAPVYSKPLMLLGVAVLCASIAGAWIAWRRARAAFWLIVAVYALMGPLLNIYAIGTNLTTQDRYLYGPLFFAVAAIATLFRSPAVRLVRRRAFVLAAAGMAIAAAFLVEIRTLDYRSNEAFWQAELSENPHNPYALETLASEAAARGEVDAAERYLARAEDPAVLRYPLGGGERRRLKAHFLRAVMLAATMPDGRGEDLEALFHELWRLEDPQAHVAPRVVSELQIGQRLVLPDATRTTIEKSLAWDIAFLATRLGDWERAKLVLDRTPRRLMFVSSSPLNGALVLARLDRTADAREIRDTLAHGSSRYRTPASTADIAMLTQQIEIAARTAKARDAARTPEERASLEAVRLAGLGAFLGALKALDQASVLESNDAAPLVAQLLVACRLDDAARAHVAARLGPERASAVVADLLAQVPERVRAMPPVPGTKDALLAATRTP